jgi:hypothetical protein
VIETMHDTPSTSGDSLTPDDLRELIAPIAQAIAERPFDAALEAWLDHTYGPQTPAGTALFECCRAGVAAGWLCAREAAGIRYGRIFKPDPMLAGFSVDVVDMAEIAGPHHVHPLGEIDFVMPQTEGALFDGRGAGWVVYGPGSAHSPTVSAGRALVLYLLPSGQIRFS